MGRVARVPCVTCGALVLLFCASLMLCSSGPPPGRSFSRALEEARSQPAAPEVVVFTTHHKTGTVMAGCYSNTLAKRMRRLCKHSILTDYQNKRLDLGSIDTKLKEITPGDSQDLPDPGGGGGGRGREKPYLILRTGHVVATSCFDSADVEAMGVDGLHPSEWLSRGVRKCPQHQCPCRDGEFQCLGLGGHCYSGEHLSSLDPSRLLLLHLVRNPLDVVLSAYSYHMQVPAVEEWLLRDRIGDMGERLASKGIDTSILEWLGMLDPSLGDRTYWHHLRSLPEEKGLVLEMVRSANNNWHMARQMARWNSTKDGQHNVRFEDLSADPAKALAPFLDAIRTPCFERHRGEILRKMLKRCHVASWSKDKLKSNVHVTTSKNSGDSKRRMAELLLSNAYAREMMHGLQRATGYPLGYTPPSY